MKKLLLRTLGLTAIVLMSNLPSAKAADGDCHIYCCNGYTYDGPAAALGYSSCCDIFRDQCNYFGDASYEAHGWINYCRNFGTCEN
jgi:hypothetical protein